MNRIDHRSRYKNLTAFLLLLFSFSNCGKSQSIMTISPQEVKTKLDNKEKIIIIDVRSIEEFDGELGHIPGAILRPIPDITTWSDEFSEQKEQEIVMVCRSGNRSSRATSFLQEQGFSNVRNMSGGMLEWNKLEFPIEKNNSSEDDDGQK